MREIKFRAWDGKEMHTSIYTETLIGLKGLKQTDDYILCQFTGLLDKNGKEIYEGDILAWTVNGNEPILAPVGFEGGAFWMLEAINRSWGNVYNDWLRGEYEVLGNRFENPELLKKAPHV